ncbi:hypothetical protein IAU60_006347 [Kwoniella sp. DSM 27419]
MFRWEDCTEAHILLGLALSLMSTLCLWPGRSRGAVLMLLAFVTLVLSLLKVGRFMWNPVYFRTTAGRFMYRADRRSAYNV